MCRGYLSSLWALGALLGVVLAIASAGSSGHGIAAKGLLLAQAPFGDLAAWLLGEGVDVYMEASCGEGTDPFLLPLPERDGMVRVLVVSERPIGRARLVFEDGTALGQTSVLEAGLPYGRLYSGRPPQRLFRSLMARPPWGRQGFGSPGHYRLRLITHGEDTARGSRGVAPCVDVPLSAGLALSRRRAPFSGVWETTRSWDDGWERAFSAWIAWLFRPLPGQPVGWRPLHQVLRNPERNLLHDALGLGEDSGYLTSGNARTALPAERGREGFTLNAYERGVLDLQVARGTGARGSPGSRRGRDSREPRITAWADCGDVPYQLRAYFAWKHGLPFRFRRCTRGTGTRGPKCSEERDNHFSGHDAVAHPVARLNSFLREGVAWIVHSGTTRTLPEDEGSDFYPIRLSRETIRPGTIFVDVGGHVLVVTQWDSTGLYAIDGHPDFSVTRRRFSPEYFRYFRGTRTGGFKAFRPLHLSGDRLLPMPNRKVRSTFSVEQYGFASGRDFYQTMGLIIATISG